MRTVALILSSQLIDYELSLDFGEQIPIFLPYQGKALYSSQIDNLPARCESVYISIPQNYYLDDAIRRDFVAEKVTVIPCKESLELWEVLIAAIGKIRAGTAKEDLELLVLYGDTLILDFSFIDSDSIFVTHEPSYYRWGKLFSNDGQESVFAGGLSTTKLSLFSELLSRFHDVTQALQSLIDSKNSQIQFAEHWLDFGHLGTYYQSRKLEIESRHFNSIKLFNGVVTKSSTDDRKLRGEVSWFKSIPTEFLKFTPPLLAENDNQYKISFVPFPTLFELHIFGRLTSKQWQLVFKRIFEVFAVAKRLMHPIDIEIVLEKSRELIEAKTWARFSNLDDELWFLSFGKKKSEIKGFVKDRVELLIDYINKNRIYEILGVLHGDMCSTNVFYSYLADTVKLIDPRGISHDGTPLIYGDITYDLAKLYQSLFLGYDAVLAGKYSIQLGLESPQVIIDTYVNYNSMLETFGKVILAPLGVPLDYVKAKAILLLLSLIPLHSDYPERQKAFLYIVYFELAKMQRVKE